MMCGPEPRARGSFLKRAVRKRIGGHMPTLHAHSYELFLIARKAAKAAREDSKRPNALTTGSLNALVIAAAAVEAFLNELAHHVEVIRASASSAREAISPQLATCSSVLQDLEDSRASVKSKYLMASLVLSGRSFEKGQDPFQDFAKLIDLRNEIMHAKPVTGDEHRGTKIATALERRGVAKRLFPDVSTDWFHILESPGVGAWACKTALRIIRATLAFSPAPPEPGLDPLKMLRQFDRPFLDRP